MPLISDAKATFVGVTFGLTFFVHILPIESYTIPITAKATQNLAELQTDHHDWHPCCSIYETIHDFVATVP